jgi:hypothetical protein
MNVIFIIEDGTAKSDATSYVSVEDMKQYFFNVGYDYDSLTDDDIKRLLNKSTFYIDTNYDFPGYRQTGTQSLTWPRSSAYYLDGYNIDESYIPPEIINAVCETANLINTGSDPFATISKDGKVIAESSAVDVIKESTKFEEGSVLYSDVYVIVDSALYRLTGGVSNNFTLSVIRTGGDSA